METTIMENQMEKKKENEMETRGNIGGYIRGYILQGSKYVLCTNLRAQCYCCA